MTTPRAWDEGRWQRKQDVHYLSCPPAKVNRWGYPLQQWRTMLERDRREVVEYLTHPRREGRDELADQRREGRGEWRPLVRE